MLSLGGLPGGLDESYATAVSADGSIIVGAGLKFGDFSRQQAFRWTSEGGMVGLGFLAGGKSSRANGISADGSVIVGSGTNASGDSRAWIWDAENGMREVGPFLTTLGVDFTGWELFSADVVSQNGDTIVGSGYNSRGDNEAWIASLPEPGKGVLATGVLLTLGLIAQSRKRTPLK